MTGYSNVNYLFFKFHDCDLIFLLPCARSATLQTSRGTAKLAPSSKTTLICGIDTDEESRS